MCVYEIKQDALEYFNVFIKKCSEIVFILKS